MRPVLRTTVVLLSAGALLVTPGIASAAPSEPEPVVMSTAVVAPFNLELFRGKVYVADGFANQVGRLKPDGSMAPVVTDAPGTAGVAHSKNGKYLAYTVTEGGPPEGITTSGLRITGPRGPVRFVNTLRYETKRNPDAKYSYGPMSDDACVVAALGPQYQGLVDSHAYSVTAYGNSWLVADAGANAILKIDNRGRIRTLATLPPQPYVITAEAAAALELPDCVVGVTYRFEAVPTDVEVGKDGYLYVTTLPGGPETIALGARGKLWRVHPRTGRVRLVAKGFAGATNLAIGQKGEIYVAEYFAGKISVVRNGRVRPFLDLHNVVALEAGKRGELWAGTTINLDPTLPPVPGTIVKIAKGKWSKAGLLRR